MQKFVLLYIVAFSGFAFFVSCDNNPKKKENTKTEVKVVQNDNLQKKSFVYTKYELPLSVDVYKFLKSKKVRFNGKYMHNLREKEKYFTEINRAQILGVYSSDLAYSTIYEKSQEAVDYFGVAIDLAYKLNIGQGYESQVLDKAYDHIDNNDTLSKIASNAYLKTCTALEKSNRENVLPFIILGSWIESMYVLSNACTESSQDQDLFLELFEQKKHLESMISYFTDMLGTESESGKDELKAMLKMLQDLKSKYDKIDQNSAEELDADKLKEVIVTIQEIRSKLI